MISKLQSSSPLFSLLAVLVLTLAMFSSAHAQQGGTTQYFYDDNGRLYAVVAPNGEAAIYDYDPAGNLIAIRRQTSGSLVLFSFAPREGVPGDAVTFLGTGFTPGQTTVSFNGSNAQVIESEPTRVVATVPDGATTGFVMLTTPSGTVTTATPFILRGMKVTPPSARILFTEALPLTATVYSQTLDPTVQWSVNGVNGGNSDFGFVSTAGIYTAPSRVGIFTVRATVVADPTIFAESQVSVRDPSSFLALFSTLSVRRGIDNGGNPISSSVSISRGASTLFAPQASAVSVRRGINNGGNPTSSSVSVSRGPVSLYAPQAPGISVQYKLPNGTFTNVAAVSVVKAPVISGVSPLTVRRGNSTTITISGSNLGEVASLMFINGVTGEISSGITVTGIVSNPAGTVLTATINVPSNILLGQQTIVVSDASISSSIFSSVSNSIQIVQ